MGKRTNKEEMVELLKKMQQYQLMTMGIVSMEIQFRLFDDDDYGVIVVMYSEEEAIRLRDTDDAANMFKHYYFYGYREMKENKRELTRLIDQLKAWNAL